MSNSEAYIPNARDAVIAYFGGNGHNVYRTHCVKCCDEHPLTNASKIYGDLYIPDGDRSRAEEDERCDICNVSLLSLSEQCQREHDEQQARWARIAAPTVLIENGIQTAIRCRVY